MWPDNPYASENEGELQHAYPSGQFGVHPGASDPLSQNRADREYEDDNYE